MAMVRSMAVLLLPAIALSTKEVKPASCPAGLDTAACLASLAVDTDSEDPSLLQVGIGRSPSAHAWKFVPPIERTVVVNGVETPGFVLELRKKSETITFECIAGSGGRITQLKFNGENLMVESESGPSKVWGTSFWTSPQSTWGWPPPDAFDTDTYEAEVDEAGKTVTLKGPVVKKLGVRIVKRYTADEASGGIFTEYGLEAPSAVDFNGTSLAGWEITRLKPVGMLAFKADGPIEGFEPQFSLLPTDEESGYYWYNLSVPLPKEGKLRESPTDPKDGPASLSYVKPGCGDEPGAVLVKSFPLVSESEVAPGEGLIEIYSYPEEDGTQVYTEMESQGRYEEVTHSQPYKWRNWWGVRRLPCGMACGPEIPYKKLIKIIEGMQDLGWAALERQ